MRVSHLRQLWRSDVHIILAVAFFSLPIKNLMADDTAIGTETYQLVRVGNVARITPEWRKDLSQSQLRFYDTLVSMKNVELNDGLPFGRLSGLYKRRELDCVVDRSFKLSEGYIASSHDIRFEMVIFGRQGENLFDRNVVTVGYLATLPQFPLPFVQPVEWYGLKTIQQGADLVRIGRIDVLIAHREMFADDSVLEVMPFPPVRVVELTVQCHDTPKNRNFLSAFDRRMNSLSKQREQSTIIGGRSSVLF